MAGAEEVFDRFVFARVGVFVEDDERDGGAGGFAFEDAGEDLRFVFFSAGSDVRAVPRLAEGEIGIDLFFGDREAGGAAVDDDADRFAMGFSPGGDAKEGAEELLAIVDLPLFDPCAQFQDDLVLGFFLQVHREGGDLFIYALSLLDILSKDPSGSAGSRKAGSSPCNIRFFKVSLSYLEINELAQFCKERRIGGVEDHSSTDGDDRVAGAH